MRRLILPALALIMMASGCNLAARTPARAPTPVEPSPLPPTATLPVLPTDTLAPTEPPTATTAPSPTSSAVIITASTGGINIRRGPGVAYNVIAGLEQGSSATALGRNEDASWLFISVPGSSSMTGWISTLSGFSMLEGSVNNLVIQPHPPAIPAYIRNCTFHPMLVTPGDVLLAEQTSAPENMGQFNPGPYRVYDRSVSDSLVKEFRLAEGDTIDILTDGLNSTYACP